MTEFESACGFAALFYGATLPRDERLAFWAYGLMLLNPARFDVLFALDALVSAYAVALAIGVRKIRKGAA